MHFLATFNFQQKIWFLIHFVNVLSMKSYLLSMTQIDDTFTPTVAFFLIGNKKDLLVLWLHLQMRTVFYFLYIFCFSFASSSLLFLFKLSTISSVYFLELTYCIPYRYGMFGVARKIGMELVLNPTKANGCAVVDIRT